MNELGLCFFFFLSEEEDWESWESWSSLFEEKEREGGGEGEREGEGEGEEVGESAKNQGRMEESTSEGLAKMKSALKMRGMMNSSDLTRFAFFDPSLSFVKSRYESASLVPPSHV